MISVNTSISDLAARNFARLNQNQFSQKLERLSSGSKLNYSSEDPSGMAISSGMSSQVRGIDKAIQNIQDDINLLHTADSFLDDLQDVLLRMRDLSVRLANEAVVNNHPTGAPNTEPEFHEAMQLHKEIELLKDHIHDSFSVEIATDPVTGESRLIPPLLNFNTKNLFDSRGAASGPQRGFVDGQFAQVGPDNVSSHRLDVVFSDVMDILEDFDTRYDPPPPDGDASSGWYTGYARFRLDDLDAKLDKISDTRTEIGAIESNLRHTLNDLHSEYTWISRSRSQIKDADIASETLEFTKTQIVLQTANIAQSQANAEALLTIPLLKAI